MLYALDIFGTFAFAVSGALRAVRYKLDLLGVLVLATATGVAGGVIRDTVLGATPPTALVDHWYVLTCLLGGIVVFVAAPAIAARWDYVMIADAIGLSVFAAIGSVKAELCGATPMTVVIMAAITACGGGVIRDLLVTRIPSVLIGEFYATAALAGGTCFLLLGKLTSSPLPRFAVAMAVTLVLRLVAMKWNISLPRVKSLPMSPTDLAGRSKDKPPEEPSESSD